jgi:hypothetical protein
MTPSSMRGQRNLPHMDRVERSWDVYRDARDASIELTFHAPRVASAFSNGLNDGSRDTSGKLLVSLVSLHKPSARNCRFRLLL